MKVVIPQYKWNDTTSFLKNKTRLWMSEHPNMSLQDSYDCLVKNIEDTLVKFGKRKKEESTDDKLAETTKNLITKIEELRKVDNKIPRQRIKSAKI